MRSPRPTFQSPVAETFQNMLLAHHFPPFPNSGSPFHSTFYSPSSSPSPSLNSTFYHQAEKRGKGRKEEREEEKEKEEAEEEQEEGSSYPSYPIPAIDLSYCVPESDAYIIDSRQSTPYDNPVNDPQDSPLYMPIAYSPNPRLRIQQQQSIPRHTTSSAAVTPPPMNEGSNWGQPSWNNFSSDQAYLNPQGQQLTNPSTVHSSHKRLSSGSSVGSAGPASPYTQTQSYPHIVDLEAASAASPQIDPYDISYPQAQQAQQYPKPLYAPSNALSGTSIFTPAFQNLNISAGNDAVSMMAGHNALRQAMAQQNASNMNAAGQRHPRRSFGGMDAPMGIQTNIPKLDRTVSDVYQDELYDSSMPSSVPTSHQSHHQQHQQPRNLSQAQLLSPSYRSVFNDRLQQANTARSSSPSTNISRERSPFRDDSEFAGQTLASNGSAAVGTSRINSAAQMREQQKMHADAQAYAQQHPNPTHHDYDVAPKTISPKEALLDYDETQEDAKISALPLQGPRDPEYSSAHAGHPQSVPGETNTASNDRNNHLNTNNSTGVGNTNDAQNYASIPSSSSTNNQHPTPTNLSSSQQSSPNYTFIPPSIPSSAPTPTQQYPFIFQSRRHSSSMRSGQSDQVPEFPASLTSMESTKSEAAQEQNIRPPAFVSHDTPSSSQRSDDTSPAGRPSDTSASSGTYTCTASGCTARFETSSKLQKHRRESHRTSSHRGSTPITPSTSTSHPHNPQAAANNVSRNNAPGPHKCERVNPSTGKPCNTVFSRSYDLTRHEDTIHNNRKAKVRCHLCTEEKTFSRNDALTRHMRVVHPDVDFPLRNRRRGGG